MNDEAQGAEGVMNTPMPPSEEEINKEMEKLEAEINEKRKFENIENQRKKELGGLVTQTELDKKLKEVQEAMTKKDAEMKALKLEMLREKARGDAGNFSQPQKEVDQLRRLYPGLPFNDD